MRSIVNGKTIYNVYDASGKLVHVHKKAGAGQALERSDYVTAGGKAIARDVLGGTTYYTFSDHLGSPVATMNGMTGAIDRERYTPFGISLNNPSVLDDQAGFAGHIKDSATGLNYMQARYYDPVIGRFLSIDPMTMLDMDMNPNYFNRYSYTANDPVNAIDPDGQATFSISLEWWAAGSFGIGGAMEVHFDFDTLDVAWGPQKSWGAGLGASVGLTGQYCKTCSLADVASGKSSSINVDLPGISGEYTWIDDAGDDKTITQGGNHTAVGVGLGLGLGVCFGQNTSHEIPDTFAPGSWDPASSNNGEEENTTFTSGPPPSDWLPSRDDWNYD